MAITVEGTVGQVDSKNVTTKFGAKTTYSFFVDGHWYRTNFKSHNLRVGDVVKFDYNDTQYGKDVNFTTLQKTGTEWTAPASVSTSGTTPMPTLMPPAPYVPRATGSKGVFPIPLLDGQRSIVRQNALTNARELVVAMCPAPGVQTLGAIKKMARHIVAVAPIFESYSCGDDDLAEATKSLEEVGVVNDDGVTNNA